SSRLSNIFDDCALIIIQLLSASLSWPLLFDSFGHGLIRGHFFSILLATVQSVAVSFQFFWPPFNPWTFLFVSFGHRLIRGRCFSILLATVQSVDISFQFFWPISVTWTSDFFWSPRRS